MTSINTTQKISIKKSPLLSSDFEKLGLDLEKLTFNAVMGEAIIEHLSATRNQSRDESLKDFFENNLIESDLFSLSYIKNETETEIYRKFEIVIIEQHI